MKKKAQGMPIQVIIIAVIALLILVILIAIFSGKMKIFSKTAADCSSKGGECKGTYNEQGPNKCSGEDEVYLPGTDCEKEGSRSLCCQKLY